MSKEILIIDDNLDIRQLVSGILVDHGFTVREAANYDQALLEINKKLPDVAIIDVKLDKGDNDGIELLERLKKIDDEVFKDTVIFPDLEKKQEERKTPFFSPTAV